MRKLLCLLMLTALFVSCSSDDDTDPNNENGNNNGMIDEKILGKWKVEYSKTIKPARYLEDGTLEIEENAVVTEYMGNYDGTEATTPKSGMFHPKEYLIDIKKDNNIYISQIGNTADNKDIAYKIENDLLITGGYWDGINNTGTYIPKQFHKYSLNNNTLTIEFIGAEEGFLYIPFYTISEYSKITE